MRISWVAFTIIAVVYFALHFLTQTGSIRTVAVVLFLMGGICYQDRLWTPSLMLCGLMFITIDSSHLYIYISLFLGLMSILTVHGIFGPVPLNSSGRLCVSITPFWLLTVGFVTCFYHPISDERFLSNCIQMVRLAVVFGGLPFLCAQWVNPRHARSYVTLLAVVLVIFNSLKVFMFGDLAVKAGSDDLLIGVKAIGMTRTHIGPTLAIGCCTLWGLLLTERRHSLKIAFVAIWGLGIATTMYTGARGALIAEAAICILVTCLAFWHTRHAGLLILGCLIVPGIVLAVQWCLPQVWDVVEARFSSPDSEGGNGRFDRWQWSLDFFLSHPYGVGWTLTPLDRENHAHNDLLIMAMSYGIAGAAAFLAAFIGECRFLFSNMRLLGLKSMEIYLPCFACLAALAMCGFTDMILVVGSIFDVAWLIVLLAHASGADDGEIEVMPVDKIHLKGRSFVLRYPVVVYSKN